VSDACPPLKEQGRTKTENNLKQNNNNNLNNTIMIVVPVKEGENIERALKKFKRKYEKTGIVKELRARQAFQKPSVINRKKMMKAVYVQQLRQAEQ
jgi:small subunit ribosomal protein S21